jgi:hypothetical protein
MDYGVAGIGLQEVAAMVIAGAEEEVLMALLITPNLQFVNQLHRLCS